MQLSTRTGLLNLYPLTPQSPDTPVNHDGNWSPDKKPTLPVTVALFTLLVSVHYMRPIANYQHSNEK